jgi:hypothetical protein
MSTSRIDDSLRKGETKGDAAHRSTFHHLFTTSRGRHRSQGISESSLGVLQGRQGRSADSFPAGSSLHAGFVVVVVLGVATVAAAAADNIPAVLGL